MSLYPAWAVDQVQLVHKLGLRERRFGQRRILVRWHEGWVDPSKLRESLTGILAGVSSKVNNMATGPGGTWMPPTESSNSSAAPMATCR